MRAAGSLVIYEGSESLTISLQYVNGTNHDQISQVVIQQNATDFNNYPCKVRFAVVLYVALLLFLCVDYQAS